LVWAGVEPSCNLQSKMIPYEDLDRALARWKARRSGGAETVETMEAVEAVLDERTPGPIVAAVATFQARDSTGELDLVDAILDEA
jgi:hypothetical protein